MSRVACAIVVLLLTAAAAAEPILHEYVPAPQDRDDSRWAREGRLPDHLRIDDRLLPSPGPAGGDDRVIGPRTADRQTEMRPDRTTTHDGVLRYNAEFNPSVVPFKRMGALDRVNADFSLDVADATLRPVSLARRPTPPDRDPFWGTLELELKRNQPLPIPSVAPQAAIVSYRSTPAAKLSFFRDSADNFWVRAPRSGRLRLVFVTDAPRSYFSAEIPPLVTAAQVPPALRPRLPATVRSAAGRVIDHVGVRRKATIFRQLERLVTYFRNFRAEALERDSGNTYLDIALSQRGVCRHRSYAFVITAQALGIPARFVHNEAHAFSEVFVPRLGWIRVDLGGASTELRVSNAGDKAVHDPGPDVFPRPSAFDRSYSQLGTRVRGIDPGQRLRRGARSTNLRDFDRSGAPGNGPGATADRGDGEPPTNGEQSPSAGTPPSRPAAEVDGDPLVQPPEATRLATRVQVNCQQTAVRRGERLRVYGTVSAAGEGVGGLRVELYLSKDGQTAEGFLGAGVTAPDGSYDVELPVPRSLVVGRYRLYAITPGDTRHQSSLSR